MIKDLHIHSSFSDGQYSVNEILKKVIDKKIDEFSITDHDNILGAVKMQKLIKEKNLNLTYHIGVEISSRIEDLKTNVHLLCYDFDTQNQKVLNLLKDLEIKRKLKAINMIKFIENNFKISFSKQEIDDLFKNNFIVAKPHLYALLSKYQKVDREDYYDIMSNFDSDKTKADALNVLKIFHNAGGKVVLAHPKEIEKEYNIDSILVVGYLSKFGLDGLEVFHSSHNKTDIERYCEYTKKFNLFITQGSDYHGKKVKPDTELGVCEKT